MNTTRSLRILIILIVILACFASVMGIFYKSEGSEYLFESVRGEQVKIYGRGLYHHMSADVAIQGIAQDIVTLFLGIPLLMLGLWKSSKGSVRWNFFLAGILKYFFITYLFYMCMAMYNHLFLVYVCLAGLSFYSLIFVLLRFKISKIPKVFNKNTPTKSVGFFLIINAVMIAILWLQIVIPPVLNGTIIPKEVEHYTTLIVQGMDLSILLPLSFLSGLWLIRKQNIGYLLAPIVIIFLCLLMLALVAKIIAMGMSGQNIIPVIFIIPTITLISIFFSIRLYRNIQEYEIR